MQLNIFNDLKPIDISKLDIKWRHFLVHSYLYYQLDKSVIADSEYDNICRYLLNHYDHIKESETMSHKELRRSNIISKSTFISASGFDIPLEKYPRITVSVANGLIHNTTKGNIENELWNRAT